MTLVEVAIATVIFAMVAGGILGVLLQSRKFGESNIYQTTAHTVAQGFVEQIKTLDFATLAASAADPVNVPLPTLGVAPDGAGGSDVVPQPLLLGVRNPVGVIEAGVHRGVLFDLVSNGAGGFEPRYVRIWVTPTVTDLRAVNGWQCLEFQLNFEWEARDLGADAPNRTGVIRFVKSNVPSF